MMKRAGKMVLGFLVCLMLVAAVMPMAMAETFFEFKLPFEVTVEKGAEGELAPLKTDLSFRILDVEQMGDGISGTTTTVSVDNFGTFSGEFSLKVNDRVFARITDGVRIKQEVVDSYGWTVSDKVWIAVPIFEYGGNPETSETTVVITGWRFYDEAQMGGDPSIVGAPVEYNKATFVNTYTDKNVSFNIPFKKIVEQTGNEGPGEVDFEFEAFVYGEEMKENKIEVNGNTVTTNGKGEYSGMLEFTLRQSELYGGDFGGGFYVREVKGTADGWTYCGDTWYVSLAATDAGYQFFKVVNGDFSPEDARSEMIFTNNYTAPPAPGDDGSSSSSSNSSSGGTSSGRNPSSNGGGTVSNTGSGGIATGENKAPVNSDVPRTADGTGAIWTALMLAVFAASGVVVVMVLKKQKVGR